MATKLTLSVKKNAIEKAKAYAKEHGTSVSNLVEDYFEALNPSKASLPDLELSPGLRALVGCIKLPADKDYKEIVAEYLEEKYR